MGSQRILLGLVIATASCAAAAQVQGSLRWRGSTAPTGLQAGLEARLPCGSYTLSCGDATTVPLYASVSAPRTLSMQVTASDQASALRMPRQGLNVSLVGKAGIYQDLGIYGRVGTTVNRGAPSLAGAGAGGSSGLTYGLGFSWDFARSASASMGLDSYDLRGNFGDSREVRTSLGLQWRY